MRSRSGCVSKKTGALSMCSKYKFICCVLWLYDFMTTTTRTATATTMTPLKFIISMLHRIFKAAFPFGGWHECAENLKWKFIVLLSAWQAFASVWYACSHSTCPLYASVVYLLCCSVAEEFTRTHTAMEFSHGAHKSHFNCFVKIRWMENMNT